MGLYTRKKTPRITLLAPHDAQKIVLAEAKRFNVVNCGRRWGKDIMHINLAIEAALNGGPVGWFAPNYDQLLPVWQDVKRRIEPVMVGKSEQHHQIQLSTGGLLEFWSMDASNTARGRKYRRVIINEAAHIPGMQESWEEVIRPTLSDYQGDAWFPSTPNGFNFFKVLYDRGEDELQGDWAAWTFPTETNPYIKKEEIEAARKELPESVFLQEYMAVFISDGTSVFRRVLENSVLERGVYEAGHQYVIGVDWGKVNDFSVFSVVDATEKKQVWVDRSNRLEYVTQVKRLKAICDYWKPVMVVCETNAMGQAIVEWVQRSRVPVYGWNTNQTSKQRMIEDLVLALEQDKVKLLMDRVQVSELQAFTSSRTSGGMMKYGAPEGQHDDMVIALALAWQAAKGERRQTRQRDFVYVA